MNKVLALIVLGLCLSVAIADSSSQGSTTFPTSVPTPVGKGHATLFDVWPAVDGELKKQFWYYLRGANPLYEASIDSPLEYLFFTVYRNTVGTFLVSTSWDKATQVTKINSFVLLGNGYDSSANGRIYDPVLIDPFVISIALGPNEFMVVVKPDGTVTVTGNKELYELEKNGGAPSTNTFNVAADMAKKLVTVDQLNRDQYWYYLNNSTIIAQSSIATNDQYYFVFIYVNPIGTFFALAHWNIAKQTAGINTLVRLGEGIPIGANFGPVNLSPSVLKLQTLN
jgi:hypothetical protein